MKSMASSIQPSFAAASTRHCSRVMLRYQGSEPETLRAGTATALPPSVEKRGGSGDRPNEVVEEQRASHAVGDTVIARQGERHHRTDGGSAVDRHHTVGDRADREDPCLRRDDDRGEAIDVVHPEIADGEGGPGAVGGLE